MKQVFTTGEVAKILNVAPRTICKWFDAGKLRGYRMSSVEKHRLIPRDSLVAFCRLYGIDEKSIPTDESEVGEE